MKCKIEIDMDDDAFGRPSTGWELQGMLSRLGSELRRYVSRESLQMKAPFVLLGKNGKAIGNCLFVDSCPATTH